MRLPNNYISTTRYTFYNFFFKNLWEQFHRVANIYFVALGIITLTPASPVSPGPYIAVIIIVLGIVMAKDCWEDFQRFRSDRELNRSPARLLRGTELVEVQWQEVQVGDILQVRNDEPVPADLLLLSSEKENGQCHVQTANLDGEINLKIRESVAGTRHMRTIEQLNSLRMTIDCEPPSADLHKFDCTVTMDGETVGVGPDQLLLRSTVLKNAAFAFGVVVYSGPQTKYMQNTIEPPHKTSLMEHRLNRYIWWLLAFLVGLCILSASLGVAFEYNTANNAWYIRNANTDEAVVYWIVLFAAYLVIYGDIIPISLYVTMEMVRLLQGLFIEVDLDIYSPGPPPFRARCLTTMLNEELGQIEYIFSDKTGTLTANKMTLRSCFINGRMYGDPTLSSASIASGLGASEGTGGRPRRSTDAQPLVDGAAEPGAAGGEAPSALQGRRGPSNFDDPKLRAAFQASRTDSSHDQELAPLFDFFIAMAICNTVYPSPSESDHIDYEFESPDELALVKGAASQGIVLRRKETGHVTVSLLGDEINFTILNVLAFDADRKRMSVIVRFPDNSIRMLIKGADSSMFPIVAGAVARRDEDENDGPVAGGSAAVDQIREQVDQLARNGLRVLVLGQRILSEEQYAEWDRNYWEPTVNSFGPEKQENLKRAIAVVEDHVVVLGATGIEDELQEHVPDTIASLKLAGIKMWVLTGDKLETAITIGHTCSLIDQSTVLMTLSTDAEPDANQKEQCMAGVLQGFVDQLEANPPDDRGVALVINGTDIPLAISKANRQQFLRIAEQCASVIVCRATPRDKRKVVKLVKNELAPLTLAIGDGANDVPMLQEADVGVGIRGEEGTQAVNSSDYAIGRFFHLKKLLLVHGHWNYKRMALLILYSFYKNIAISLIPLWFAIENGWSGYAFFDSLTRRGYNLIFTSAPIIVMCVLDQDVYAPGLLKYPQLYRDCQNDTSFNLWVFGKWIAWGIFDSLICYYFPRLANWGEINIFDSTGKSAGLEMLALTSYTLLIVIANLRLAFHCKYWTSLHYIIFILSIASWYALAIWVSEVYAFSADLYGVIAELYGSPAYWLITLLGTVTCLIPDLMWRAIRREYFPHPFHIIQERTNKKVEADLKYSATPICLEKADCPCRCCRRWWCEC